MGQLFSSTSYMSSHGDLTPVRTLWTTMILYIMVPTGAVAYQLSNGSILISMAAAITIPFIGILQGTHGIISYRLYFGDAPIPITPSHGVVICHEPTKQASVPASHNDMTESTPNAIMNHSTSSPNLECHSPIPINQKNRSFPSPRSTNKNDSFFAENRRTSYGNTESISTTTDTRRPIRLLVIGDSIAIGVGQARQCTPIMPEVLAKTLSARLGGRVVYWTCHGAPGASTGWIVRELERGVQKMEEEDQYNESDYDDYDEEDLEEDIIVDKIKTNVVQLKQNCNDVSDESSLSGDESTTLAMPPAEQQQTISRSSSIGDNIMNDPEATTIAAEMTSVAIKRQQRTIWRERLAQHRKYFDPDDLVHYDIVVVMTGGNDLKSALFPFLLTGEDAEFRRQAKARGGNYTKELLQLLQTINRDVRTRLRHIRYSVEAAAETVIEKVEQNMELIVKSKGSPIVRRMSSSNALNFHEKVNARKEQDIMLSEQSTINNISDESDALDSERIHNKKYPLVVLPGLPSRTLPIFSAAPLNWGAIPIVDILDMHKRRLANAHPGEVMFVPPPSVNQMVQYESCQGDIWRQRCQENTILALRDVRRHDCHRVTKELRKYYNERDTRQLSGDGLKKTSNDSWWLTKYITPKGYCDGIFAVDRVHPNDDGYDFYGRYIANSIADEWLAHPNMIPSEL